MSTRILMRRLPLLVAATAVAALGFGAASASAKTSKIVYVDFVGSTGNDDLFSVNPDGTGNKQLTDNGATEQDPYWSPSRRKIVFARVNSAPSHLYTMKSNGFGVHVVPHTKFGGDPAWSPNGKKFVFTVERSDFKQAIFTISVNGKHRHRLTAWSHKTFSPDWSPSGKSIVYVGPKGITRMRANGSHKKKIRSSGFEPNWSPNGKRIAFEDDASTPPAVDDIYTTLLNGTHTRNLTGTRPGTSCPDEPDECNREDIHPAWSPNGKRVLFSETSSGNGDRGIFTVKPDGSGVKQVTPSGESADW